jgi:adenosylcobinamide-phosphate synthase
MGRCVSALERRLNARNNRRAKGVLALAAMVFVAGVVGLMLSLFGFVAEVVVAAILIAQKSLVQHAAAVAAGLRQSLSQGRREVAKIVSRDTGAMDESAVARSTIESAAENLSDAVVAPAFWFLLAGLPGLLIYKMVNTADSMIGYRTARYAEFGWAAARFDDVLNFLPARLTAIFTALSSGVMTSMHDIRTDAGKHKSPNAGWPEAAMARAIDVALAGPRAYNGVMQDLAWVNAGGKHHLAAADIDASIGILWRSWTVLLLTVLVLALLSL